ncbi:MAG: hypothetical protein L3J39_08575 [Verrucomicrobiales bacterium]|nr:hypothetical protein [Verrucomicrobiales bacterium]
MKHLIAVLFFGFVAPILGGEEAAFETAEELKIGESGAFELSKNNRAILKLGENGYFVFDLLDSSREDKGKTFTEACSISWTLITPSSIKSGAISAFIRYSSVEIQEDSFTITRIAGSDTVEIEGLSIRWSYASPEQIFLYPSPGTEYAISKVEQSGAKQASTVVELKSVRRTLEQGTRPPPSIRLTAN